VIPPSSLAEYRWRRRYFRSRRTAARTKGAKPWLTTARSGHTATLLPSGKVIVAGGNDGAVFNSTEIYDPSTNTWSGGASFSTGRYAHTAVSLASGKVLGTDRLPKLARSWPKELMKCVVEKRAALNASSGLMPNST